MSPSANAFACSSKSGRKFGGGNVSPPQADDVCELAADRRSTARVSGAVGRKRRHLFGRGVTPARPVRLGGGWRLPARTPVRRPSLLSRTTNRRRRTALPRQNERRAGGPHGRSYPARRMEPGNPRRFAATLWNCSRSRLECASRSWCRFATGECSCRRSPSFAARLTSWRPTSRTARERASTLSFAATHTSRISDSSPPRIVASCSASTTSTRRCRGRSSGT